MLCSLDLLDEIRDAVEGKAGPQLPEVPGLHPEGSLERTMSRGRDAATQRRVYGLLEGLAGASRLGLEPGSDVLVERQGRSHIMMLGQRHNDVKE